MPEKHINNYSADSITVLKGLEAVRIRPAMYIGDIGKKGLHHLINEVVDNSIDEALAGFCDNISVEITKDNGIIVEDNGRGIPVDIHSGEDKPAIELVMTVLHAGGKFDKENYKVSGGLHGVGVSCVNALSKKLIAEVFKDGKHYKIEFSRGDVLVPLKTVGTSDKVGTKITFYPDDEIFTITDFDYNVVSHRLKILAFLNPALRINLLDQRNTDDQGNYISESFFYEGGLIEFVKYIDENKQPLHEPISIMDQNGDYPLDIALSWNDSYRDHMESYVNNIHTIEGGAHEEGFKSALTRAINLYAKNYKIFKNDKTKLTGNDIREGLTVVISIKIANPQFEGQTKTKLGNSEVVGYVQSIVYEKLYEYLEENPKIARNVINKCLDSLRAREAARKAKDLIRRKSAFDGGSMPTKLYDCSKGTPPLDCELLIVEGDSAGGSAVDGRFGEFQAILPLRGKILNVEKAREDKMLGNEEIKNLISAIGTGIGDGEDGFDYKKLRYGKIIIMTDADVDGAHISTLLLTFFFRNMPQLLESGHIYLAMPPLYKIHKGKNIKYVYPGPEQEDKKKYFINELGEKGVNVQRYKGLGEMNPEQLKETTLDPATRKLKKISIEDALESDRIFAMFMGSEVEPRKKYIIEKCWLAKNIDT